MVYLFFTASTAISTGTGQAFSSATKQVERLSRSSKTYIHRISKLSRSPQIRLQKSYLNLMSLKNKVKSNKESECQQDDVGEHYRNHL